MADIDPAHSLLLNGYSKRIQDLIQSTKNKISLYGNTYALKNEKINVNYFFFSSYNHIPILEHHQKDNRNFQPIRPAIQPILQW